MNILVRRATTEWWLRARSHPHVHGADQRADVKSSGLAGVWRARECRVVASSQTKRSLGHQNESARSLLDDRQYVGRTVIVANHFSSLATSTRPMPRGSYAFHSELSVQAVLKFSLLNGNFS